MTSRRIAPTLILLLAALTGCRNMELPTTPAGTPAIPAVRNREPLTGTWAGWFHPAISGDPSPTLEILQQGATVEGTLSYSDGTYDRVTGTVREGVISLAVTLTNANQFCSGYLMHIEQIDYDDLTGQSIALRGRLGGRCYGTVQGHFIFQRRATSSAAAPGTS